MCKVIISGYFCTGKTTVMNRLEKDFGLKKPIGYTTRNMRPGEKEGSPYTFITKEVFEGLRAQGKLFDPITHDGNHYGSDKASLYQGNWIQDIFPDSWDTYKTIEGVTGIYLIPPSIEVLKERAQKRGDTPESIEKRLQVIKPQDTHSYHYAIPPQKSIEDLYMKIQAIVEKLMV